VGGASDFPAILAHQLLEKSEKKTRGSGKCRKHGAAMNSAFGKARSKKNKMQPHAQGALPHLR
jgi:hypothetical protein